MSGEDIYIYYLTARGWGGVRYLGVYRSVVAVETRGEALAEAQHCRVCVGGGYPIPGWQVQRGQCNQWLGYLSIDRGDTKDWRAFLPMVPARRDLATHIMALLNMVCAYSVRLNTRSN